MSRMITAILRMPDGMYWDERPVYRAQHNANRFAAADEIERLRAELEETRKAAADEYGLASHMQPLLQDCLDFALDVPECGCAHSRACSSCERYREAQRLAEKLVEVMR